jgi:hypothetical protein
MNDNVAYSPKKEDLFFPCKNANFFSAGAPKSDSALCVELARLAYCRSDANFAFNQARITTELARIGFTVAGFFESQGTPDGRGTHCFLAVRHDQQLAVVAFRGTDAGDPTDVADDLDAMPVHWDHGGNVHRGFKTALAQLVGLEQALQAIAGRVLFTGHSLGAAQATLLASVKSPSALYTFGSPLVGDSDFVDALKNVRSFRYVDCCDIVTRIPPEALGYQHVGKPYYIARDRSVTFDPGEAVIAQDRFQAFLEYPIKYHAWRGDNVGVRELADHAPVNYVSAVMAATSPS